ncbi:MAG: hypothetical protein IJW03_00620 [Clostridia bacterium]|nr:hypothetical protein [Clostridia bacterium]
MKLAILKNGRLKMSELEQCVPPSTHEIVVDGFYVNSEIESFCNQNNIKLCVLTAENGELYDVFTAIVFSDAYITFCGKHKNVRYFRFVDADRSEYELAVSENGVARRLLYSPIYKMP